MLAFARQRGFTLIEAMTALAVLVLLVVAVAPSVSDWVTGTRVRALASAIQSGMQKARMEALRRNQVVTFWLVSPATAASLDDTCALASDSGSWVVSLDDPTSKCATAPSAVANPRIVQTYGAGMSAAGISVNGRASNGATASSVSFNGFGQTVRTGSQLARVDVSSSLVGSRRLRVSISAGGSVRMCDQDVAADDPRACI
jgi:type IV fimbrial biogenesis protein FimT